MRHEDLIHRANIIAQNFAGYGLEGQVTETRNHIRMFWEPRLKAQLLAHVADGGAGLHQAVIKAAKGLDAPQAA